MVEIRNCPAYIEGQCSANLNKLWSACNLIVDCPLKQVLQYILNSECGHVYTCEKNSEFGGTGLCDNACSDCGEGSYLSLLDLNIIYRILNVASSEKECCTVSKFGSCLSSDDLVKKIEKIEDMCKKESTSRYCVSNELTEGAKFAKKILRVINRKKVK